MYTRDPDINSQADESTADGFQFSFGCALCENKYLSSFVDFPLNKPEKEWEHEHEQAFLAARREAGRYFNRCINCGNWVCDRHFNLESRICRKCE